MEIGDVVGGKFRLLGVLGAGPESQLYRVRCLADGEVRALRVLRRDAMTRPGPVERLYALRGRVPAGAHPGVLGDEAFGVADGRPYRVTALLGPRSLRARLVAGRPLPLSDALRVGEELLAALTFCHGRGVVHGRLDAGAVRFRDDGAVVLDGFGAADEVAGRDPSDDRVAAGLLLYRLLTGVSPNPADAPALTEFLREVPPEVDRVMAALLDAGERGMAPATARAWQAWKRARRAVHGPRAAVAATSTAAVPRASVWTEEDPSDPSGVGARTSRKAWGRRTLAWAGLAGLTLAGLAGIRPVPSAAAPRQPGSDTALRRSPVTDPSAAPELMLEYLELTEVAGTSVRIRWRTSRPSGTRVRLEPADGSPGARIVGDLTQAATRDHDLWLHGLTPESLYQVQVLGRSERGPGSPSATLQFPSGARPKGGFGEGLPESPGARDQQAFTIRWLRSLIRARGGAGLLEEAGWEPAPELRLAGEGTLERALVLQLAWARYRGALPVRICGGVPFGSPGYYWGRDALGELRLGGGAEPETYHARRSALVTWIELRKALGEPVPTGSTGRPMEEEARYLLSLYYVNEARAVERLGKNLAALAAGEPGLWRAAAREVPGGPGR